MRGSFEVEFWPVKSDTVLPTARHRCNICFGASALDRLLISIYQYYKISLKGAVLPVGAMTRRCARRRDDSEMCTRKLVTRFGVMQGV